MSQYTNLTFRLRTKMLLVKVPTALTKMLAPTVLALAKFTVTGTVTFNCIFCHKKATRPQPLFCCQ